MGGGRGGEEGRRGEGGRGELGGGTEGRGEEDRMVTWLLIVMKGDYNYLLHTDKHPRTLSPPVPLDQSAAGTACVDHSPLAQGASNHAPSPQRELHTGVLHSAAVEAPCVCPWVDSETPG